MKPKKIAKVLAALVVAVGGGLFVQSFTVTDSPVVDSASNSKKFVKTKNKCNHSNCSCSGYWGYKHLNGTYEGACSNSDGWGHTCGHGPEKHGLKKW